MKWDEFYSDNKDKILWILSHIMVTTDCLFRLEVIEDVEGLPEPQLRLTLTYPEDTSDEELDEIEDELFEFVEENMEDWLIDHIWINVERE